MEFNIYYLLGGLAALYLAISIFNKRNARKRKSRKFMDGYIRKDKREKEEGN